jgi:cellulose biosynthesis protein BcsQ
VARACLTDPGRLKSTARSSRYVILPDRPPSLGLLTLAALAAADEALAPAVPDGQDAHAFAPLLAALDRLRAGRRAPRLTTVGVVATPGSGKTKAMLTLLENLKPHAGSPPELLGELPLAEEAARALAAAAIAARLRPAPVGGAPSPA